MLRIITFTISAAYYYMQCLNLISNHPHLIAIKNLQMLSELKSQPCKEFIAEFIYLSLCGQISNCDHFSHILDRFGLLWPKSQYQTPVSVRFALQEFSYNLILSFYFQYLSFFQHPSVVQNLASFLANLPVEKELC